MELFVLHLTKDVVFDGAVARVSDLIDLDDEAEGVAKKKSEHDSDQNPRGFFTSLLKMLRSSLTIDEGGGGVSLNNGAGGDVDKGDLFFLMPFMAKSFYLILQPIKTGSFSPRGCVSLTLNLPMPISLPFASGPGHAFSCGNRRGIPFSGEVSLILSWKSKGCGSRNGWSFRLFRVDISFGKSISFIQGIC